MAGTVWFEQRSPTGRVRLVQGPSCPDPRGYFLYLDEALIGRHAALPVARRAFRQLADSHDPLQRPDETAMDPKREFGDEIAHAYFASMRGSGQGKGGRGKIKRA
jgi:hypothetical protein